MTQKTVLELIDRYVSRYLVADVEDELRRTVDIMGDTAIRYRVLNVLAGKSVLQQQRDEILPRARKALSSLVSPDRVSSTDPIIGVQRDFRDFERLVTQEMAAEIGRRRSLVNGLVEMNKELGILDDDKLRNVQSKLPMIAGTRFQYSDVVVAEDFAKLILESKALVSEVNMGLDDAVNTVLSKLKEKASGDMMKELLERGEIPLSRLSEEELSDLRASILSKVVGISLTGRRNTNTNEPEA